MMGWTPKSFYSMIRVFQVPFQGVTLKFVIFFCDPTGNHLPEQQHLSFYRETNEQPSWGVLGSIEIQCENEKSPMSGMTTS